MNKQEEIEERFTVEELELKISELTPEEFVKIFKIAERYASHPYYPNSAGDLVSGAMDAILDGRRTCKKSVHFVAFMAGVMRSISSNTRNSAENKNKFINSEGNIDDIADSISKSPDEAIDQERFMNHVLALFDDDETAQLIILAISFGKEGEEIRQEVGLVKTDYESKRKKIRRRINNAMKEGKFDDFK